MNTHTGQLAIEDLTTDKTSHTIYPCPLSPPRSQNRALLSAIVSRQLCVVMVTKWTVTFTLTQASHAPFGLAFL